MFLYKRIIGVLVMVAVVVALAGCANSMPEKFATQLNQTYMGMTVSQVRHIFPELYKRGVSHNESVYAIRSDVYPGGRKRSRLLYFYFKKGKLVRWGKPGDWTADSTSDITIHMNDQKSK